MKSLLHLVGVLALFVGYTLNATAQNFDGFALYNDIGINTTFLIDKDGNIAHFWNCALPGNYTVLLKDNGNIVRGAIADSSWMEGPARGGVVQELDSNANVVYEFTYLDSNHVSHHDMTLLPNGNVILIAWERKSAAEMLAAGFATNEEKWPTHLIEVAQNGTGGQIVWEWHIWDHLIQDQDTGKPNYGVVANHPELLNINVNTGGGFPGIGDWFHINGVDYNPDLHQIVLSSRFLSEIFIIDHSTTTQEAAGHTGGNSGMGGDFLYRWGNPANHGAPFGVQNIPGPVHDPRWILDRRPNAGWIQFFNNEGGPGLNSTVDAINPPRTGYLYDPPSLSGYAPLSPEWTHNTRAVGFGQSASDRMSNGNVFVNVSGQYMYEVDSMNTLVWQFPVGPAKAFRYECDHPGIIALLGNPPCAVTSRPEPAWEQLQLYPNPTSGVLRLKGVPQGEILAEVVVRDLMGRRLLSESGVQIRSAS